CSLHARSRMSSAPQKQEDISALVPMEVVGSDFHSHRGRTYISAHDRASGYRWCEKIKNQSSSSVIQFVNKLMRLYGKITVVRADNGPCFRGPFQEYLEGLGVAFKPSSPYNPVSNSCAESSVRLNKILQQKTDCSDEKLQDFMLWSNCLVRPDGSGSPAEVFFRRHMNVPG
ncbi:MAG: transposase family protein, partial [Planctomycetes bacterium]|nr:transposase family protein [Planctomycetota bacterium]